MYVAWRSRLPRARSYRIVVRGSACEAASWISRSGTPASKRGGNERVPQRMRRDGLADPGAQGGLADDPPGAVPVQPPAVPGQEHWPFDALADGQVECPGGPRRQRDGHDLAALIRISGLAFGQTRCEGGRRQVSTCSLLDLESYAKTVPLPVTGRVDRCWDVVPAVRA